MPLDAPVMKTSGAATLIFGAARRGGVKVALVRPLRSTMRARLSYSMPSARTMLCALGDDHRQMRAQSLDVAERMQELAAEFDLLLLAMRGPNDVRIAEQLNLAAVAVGERLAGIGEGDDAVFADGADARLVDLERVVVGEVAQPLAFDLGAQGAVAAEALDDEARHRVVGLVAQRRGLARRARRSGALRTSHQVPDASTAIMSNGR